MNPSTSRLSTESRTNSSPKADGYGRAPAPQKPDFTEEELRARRFLANSRERQRTEELNAAFRRLRQTIPSMPSDKLSKIHTLRIAANYIRFLGEINDSVEAASGGGKAQKSGRKSRHFTSPYLSMSGEALMNLRATFNRWRETFHQSPSSSTERRAQSGTPTMTPAAFPTEPFQAQFSSQAMMSTLPGSSSNLNIGSLPNAANSTDLSPMLLTSSELLGKYGDSSIYFNN